MDNKIKDENYYQISGFMVNKLGLKGISLMVYAIIYGFSQDGESEFAGSRKYLCDFTGTTKPTIDKALNELCESNLIIKISEVKNSITFNRYKANLSMLDFTSGKETLPGGKETLPNNNKHNIEENIIIDNNTKGNGNIYQEIINYLNEKTNKNFRYQSTATQRLIKARLNEGFTLEDFKKVIDTKCADWLNDEKMVEYLRPETLFSNKFEGYLNSAKQKPTSKKLGFYA